MKTTLLFLLMTSLSLASSFSTPVAGDTLSNLSCTTNQIPKWNGSRWVCSSSGGGAGNDWGDIGGVLSSQTDLQNALNAKASISSLATVATSGVYSDLTGKPSLATVATSGAYSDLSGKPTLATVATSGAYSDLSGKPTYATVATTGAYSDLTGKPTLGTAAALDVGTTANKVVQFTAATKYPAVDGSLITNLTSEYTTDTVTTSNNTATTLHTQALSDVSAYTCEALVSGFRTDSQDSAHWKVIGSAYRNGGACVFEDSTKIYEKRSDVVFDAVWSCSSNSLLLKVTGNTGKTIDFKARVFCQQVQ